MYSACDIAKYVITLANKYDDEITQLKLQKLLYYIQGTYLGAGGYAVFDDEMLAWKHGPVVHAVWQQYKDCGKEQLQADVSDISLEPFDKETIEEIYKRYRTFTTKELVDKTHGETPWINARDDNDIITKESIKDYFSENVFSYEQVFGNIPIVDALPVEDYDPDEDSWYDEWKEQRVNDRKAV
jgi:uncharacterized phage-associated protein